MAYHQDRKMADYSFEWTRKLTLALIELYREEPFLWDPTHEDYKNRNLKFKTYKRIADRLRVYYPACNQDEVRKRIQSLRCQHRREMKLEKEHAINPDVGDDDVYHPKLWCYQHLKFLNGEEIDAETKFYYELQMEQVRILELSLTADIMPFYSYQ